MGSRGGDHNDYNTSGSDVLQEAFSFNKTNNGSKNSKLSINKKSTLHINESFQRNRDLSELNIPKKSV